MAELPSYPLELHKADGAEDAAAHLLVHNINADELVAYINQLREYIQEAVSTDTQGTTISQVNALIESAKYVITIPVVWATSSLPIDPANPSLGTMTRTNNSDGSAVVVITNIKNSAKTICQVQSYAGDVVHPKISVTTTYITLRFSRRIDIDQTSGHANALTDPNIKKLIIF